MALQRRAKIVCTLGPATSSAEQIGALIDAGMNVARLNLSHGNRSEHEELLRHVRAESEKRGAYVAVLADLQGPKIRLGKFVEGVHELKNGASFIITMEEIIGDSSRASSTYKDLAKDCTAGDILLIDDGKVRLQVSKIEGSEIFTTVRNGGLISNNKGINAPGSSLSVPALSPKDITDLEWALGAGVDLIALSFVRTSEDIEGVHAVMDRLKKRIPVIAKIEKPQAVSNLDQIVSAFDGLMVARGDLGVELPIEEVPLVQKKCIIAARENAKPVIVATQMLESMISAPTPTRAEATDCANAVLDGADALMLSGETSVGKYPTEAVSMMSRIIAKIEEEALAQVAPLRHNPHTKSGAITKAAAEVGAVVGARFLVAFTQSGDSARRMSRLRSVIPILALTPEVSTAHQLALSWGVEPILIPPAKHTDEMVKQIDSALLDSARAAIGEYIVIVAGSPPGIPGSTNAMRVHRVGDAVGGIAPAYR
jgi:pyruvate kinase